MIKMISRDALSRYKLYLDKGEKPDARTRGWNAAIEYIQSKEPGFECTLVRHGKWIDQCRGKVRVCSRCDQEFDNTCNAIDDEWLFCPNCGARMDGEAK